LFASERLIWIASAELALPRRLSATAEETGEDGKPVESELQLSESSNSGVVLVFECSRYDFTGTTSKIERVQKYYSGIGAAATVEFVHYTPESSRHLARIWRVTSV